MQMREKVEKPGMTVFFPPEGRKVGSLKRRVRRHLARWGVKNCTPLWREHISKSKCTKHVSFGEFLGLEMSKKCTPLWREAHFEVNMYKARRNTFGSWDVEKVHAVVARSTRRFCAKHTSKSTCTKHLTLGNIFGEVEMLKKCTSLWARRTFSKSKCTKHHKFAPLLEVEMFKSARRCGAKHHFDAKSVKNWRSLGPLLGAQMPFRMAGARDCAPSPCQKWAKCDGFVAVSTAATIHYTPPHPTTQLQLQQQPQPHYITLTTLHYTPVRCTTLHSFQITLHYTNYNYSYNSNYNYTTLHYTTLIILYYTTLRFTSLHSIALHYTTRNYTTTTAATTTTTATTLHYATLR